MLGHGLARHGEVLAQFAKGLPVAVVQPIEQLSPARIGQGFKDFVHCLGLCNQMVACQAAWTFRGAVPGRSLTQRAAHADAGLVEHVRVNHRRAHILVT